MCHPRIGIIQDCTFKDRDAISSINMTGDMEFAIEDVPGYFSTNTFTPR
jgi:hypothetical protein